MALRIIKRIIRRGAWKAKRKTLLQVLPSRCRRAGMPEYGRFTPGDIKRIIGRSERYISELMPFFHDTDAVGNYLMQYGGLIDLAVYRALVKEGVDEAYAADLVADMIWQARINSGGLVPLFDPLRLWLAGLTAKDPMDFLEKRLKDGMRFPYSEPGYTVKLYRDKNMYCMDFYSCVVHDFFKQFGKEEMDLFRKAWCTFDYSVAEHLVPGGAYERKHTLSDGDDVCDMRWYIKDR